MKLPSAKSSNKVTAENLVRLGAERLAEVLAGVAETRPDLKRRLRMELAAEEGPAPLAAQIDRRLSAFETSRGQVAWRQAPAFLRDLDAVRLLIAERLAPLDRFAAVERLWRLMDAARPLAARYRERGDELAAVFERAAADLGRLLCGVASGPAAVMLTESLTRNPSGWKAWLPALLATAPPELAREALRDMSERPGAVPGWISLIRQLAVAAGDLYALRATYTPQAQASPAVAAELARRFLDAGRTEDAGEILRAAAPRTDARAGAAPDFDWEGAWIDYLEQSGEAGAAQQVRWASFERTLSLDRARAFVSRLGDFDDVEAEARIYEIAAGDANFQRGLGLLMAWPALVEAAGMIERRGDEIEVGPDAAELWAAKLRRRHPRAAQLLLRRAAAAAFRRRDFKTCDRLTAEAETIAL